MVRRIENLKTTTFFGKRLTRSQISVMQETVELLPNDTAGSDPHAVREPRLGTEAGEPVDAPLRELEPATLEFAEWTGLADRDSALRGRPRPLLALAAEHRSRHRGPARTKLVVPRLERRDPVAQLTRLRLHGGVLHAQGHDRGTLPRIDAGLCEKPAQPCCLLLQRNEGGPAL